MEKQEISRIDRILKDPEILLRAIEGLLKSQEQTGRQIAEAQKKTDAQMNRTDARIAELQLKTDLQIGELREAQKKTDAQ
ncbi:MAG: hypothetical protein V2I97_17970, partial [Desulfococcaceae bacterium]|nr:hypothetical protein [Desulfococcaceae bacterium]